MRELRNALLLLALVGTTLASVTAPRAESAAAAPSHSISVTGTGVATFPDFDESIERYGITTTDATAGTVTVQVATSGTVTVNGRPAPGGTRTVSGLEPGDEIAVFVEGATGTARHSYVYLPAGFPLLERIPADASAGPRADGLVLLTLGKWTSPSPFFETAVDANGVPAFVEQQTHAMDFQRQPNGSYTVFHRTNSPGRTGSDLVELNSRFEEVATYRTQGLVDTDPHDAIIEEDGSVWLMAYEPASTGLIDSVIQRIEPDGTVSFHWSSAEHVDDRMTGHPDYAHVNSFQVMDDGDLLVSFRHFSSVFKIATTDRPADGIEKYDVVWKLGGRDSDFAFPAGDGGPCAQHTAHELDNGNILMFDNGSLPPPSSPPPPNQAPPPFCVDPDDPAGDAVGRTQTRIVEWQLDQPDGGPWTAEPVWEYEPPFQFAIFAGSSQRMSNGNTVIGWAAETDAVATEVDEQKRLVWGIRDPRLEKPGDGRYFTYRAHKAEVPDAMAPVITTNVPNGATYVEGSTVAFDYECTDRGGSSLAGCSASVPWGGALDTSTPGTRAVTVTATDGEGNRTPITRSYTVLPASQPDAMVRLKGGPAFRGGGTYGPPSSQRVRARVPVDGRRTVQVRLQNDGASPMRLTFEVRGQSPSFRVLGRHADGGTTPRLQPGESWTFSLRVARLDAASPGDRLVLKVPVRSTEAPVRRDGVSVLVRAKG